MTSAARTLTIPAGGEVFLQWQTAETSDALDYDLDATAAIPGDLISSLAVSVSPSGAGELVAVSASAVLNAVSIQLSDGVSGRLYSVRVDATTELGRSYSWIIYLPVVSPHSTNAPPPPPVAGFGTSVQWVYSGPARPLPAVPTLPTTTYPTDFSGRTIIILKAGNQYLQWPIAEPTDSLGYFLDLSAVLGDDQISNVSVSARPSGNGELVVGSVSYEVSRINIPLSNGAAGRAYSVRVDVGTLSGRSFSWIPTLPVDALYLSPPPIDPGFGPVSSLAVMVLENNQGLWSLENNAGNWVWG